MSGNTDLLHILVDHSVLFLQHNGEHFHATMTSFLTKIRECLHASRIFIASHSFPDSMFDVVFDIHQEYAFPMPNRFETSGPTTLEVLRSGRIFDVEDASTIAERLFGREVGPRSLVMCPIHIDSKFWGFVAFVKNEIRTNTTPEVLFELSMISTVVGSAIAKNEYQFKLGRRNRILSMVASCFPMGVMAQSDRGEVIFINDKWRQIFHIYEDVTVYDQVYPLNVLSTMERLDERARHEGIVESELEIDFTGELRKLRVKKGILMMGNGAPIGIMSIVELIEEGEKNQVVVDYHLRKFERLFKNSSQVYNSLQETVQALTRQVEDMNDKAGK